MRAMKNVHGALGKTTLRYSRALTKTLHILGGCLQNRRLEDGDVHCAGSASYQICFRLPIPSL